jgi:phytanoyl-CoA hydroxylase
MKVESNTVAIDDLAEAKFQRDGYLIVPQLYAAERCRAIRDEILESLDPLRGPAEFEVDVQYPGSPMERSSDGGNTPRRLLHAYGRSQLLREWSTGFIVRDYLQRLMGSRDVLLSQSHHNCVMTKHPGYSSITSWHQDIRYWRFDRPELVSVWLALGNEYEDNGSLMFIPGSHRMDLALGRFDRDIFFRTDLEENSELLATAVSARLHMGDVVFFHSRTLHAAGMNNTDSIKLSPVFTYHTEDNQPIPGTRSASYPSIQL